MTTGSGNEKPHKKWSEIDLQPTVVSRSRGMKSFVFEPDRGVVMQENNVWDILFELLGHLGHLGTP